MKSIGNDVVDLSKINLRRTTDHRFYSKFIQNRELAAYQPFAAFLQFPAYIWLLWSVKESAYKYQKRLEPELLFSPFNITVNDIHPETTAEGDEHLQNTTYYNGKLTISGKRLFFRSAVNEAYIASVTAKHENFSEIYSDVKRIDEDTNQAQSLGVRQFTLATLDAVMQGGITLEKSEAGCPLVFQYGQKVQMPLSFAHHGNYIAYSFIAGPALLPA